MSQHGSPQIDYFQKTTVDDYHFRSEAETVTVLIARLSLFLSLSLFQTRFHVVILTFALRRLPLLEAASFSLGFALGELVLCVHAVDFVVKGLEDVETFTF